MWPGKTTSRSRTVRRGVIELPPLHFRRRIKTMAAMATRNTAIATAMPAMTGGLSDALDEVDGWDVVVEVGLTDDDDKLSGVVYFIIT